MQRFVKDHYAPFKLNVLERKDLSKTFGVLWTPTLMAARPDGGVLHQTIGWMPPGDFLTEMTYGLARAALAARDFAAGSRLLRETVARGPAHDRSPEALYWLGVSEFRRTGGIEAAKEAWGQLAKGYPASTWAGRVGWLLA